MSGSNGSLNGQVVPDKLPPQNLEAEQGALGSMLLDNATIGAVFGIIGPEHFYRASYSTIAQAIRDLHARDSPVDLVLLMEELTRRGEYDRVGGDRTMAEILDHTPHAANARYYAAIVHQLARKRALIDAANDLLRGSYDPNQGPDDLLALADERLKGVAPPAGSVNEAVATLADVRARIPDDQWLWPGWIADSHLTTVASEPGIGKTRMLIDLCRRMWFAEPWPDECLATRPPGTASLWIAADRNHGEIMRAATAMGLPDVAIFFNASPESPFGGLKLDDRADVTALARRVARVQPALLVIDTINKATRRLLYRPEEAEAFFGPLLDLARDHRVAILANTHLSRGGDPLDRRIEGVCRVSLRLERPDLEGLADRRRLSVCKSFDLYPAALGVTLGPNGNTYDRDPPTRPANDDTDGGQGGGRPPKAIAAAIQWLREYLGQGPALCRGTVEAAEEAGHVKRTFWRAVKALNVRREGAPGNQFFRLPDADEPPLRLMEDEGDWDEQ